jgi:AcrR family transcriptional regulator
MHHSPVSRSASLSPARGEAGRHPRHAEILAAAFEEFAAKGYSRTRLEDVARRAHIAKGTIYLYFRNKEALFRGVVHSLIQAALGGFDALLENFPGSAEELVRALLARHYSQVVRNAKAREILRLLIAESGKFPQLSAIYRREVVEPGLAALHSVIQKGIASGEFRRSGVARFPQMLIAPALLPVIWILILNEEEPLDLDAYRAAHLDLLLRGLRPAARAAQRGRAVPAGEIR